MTDEDARPNAPESPGVAAAGGLSSAAESASASVAPTPTAEAASASEPGGQARRPRYASREADLRLARLHLRLGSLALARAELEAAQLDEALPPASLVDLAEARWRSGDLGPAGQAARAALAAGSEDRIATVIAIEAESGPGTVGASTAGPGAAGAGAEGPPAAATTASATTAAAPAAALQGATALGLVPPTLSAAELDVIFAGMPRGPVWPPDPAQLQHPPADGAESSPRPRPPAVAPDTVRAPIGHAIEPVAAPGARPADPAAVLPNGPSAELDAAADDLAAGDDDAAAIRLAVLLRVQPPFAPAVAELLEDASSPALLIVRGDALRLVGRVTEAERAWARAAARMAPGRPPAARPQAAQSRPQPGDEPPAGAADADAGAAAILDDPPSQEEPT